MIKGGLIFILVIFFSTSNAFSQQLSQQVLLPAAGVAAGGGFNYSQTIGETAVELFTNSDLILSQGFQQPGMRLLPGTKPQGIGMKAYPNPTRDFVNVEFFGEDARVFKILMINISGTIVYSTEIGFPDRFWYILEIPVSTLTRGLYFIRVTTSDGVINRNFKIEKM